MSPGRIHLELRRLADRQLYQALLVVLFRSVWLGLAVLAAALLLHYLGRPLPWPVVVVAAVLVVLFHATHVMRRRPSAELLARRLDAHFGLREQLATAYEISRSGATGSEIQGRLIEQAGMTLQRLRRHPALSLRFPIREVETIFATGLVVVGLWLLRDTGNSLPTLPRRQLPPPIAEPAPAEMRTAPPQIPQERGEAVARLAEAFRQNSLTFGAGEALDQGNAGGAADELRELADRVGQLTPRERAELADALRAAADAVGEDLPTVQDALERAADSLEQGSDAEAAEALEDLAGEIEALGGPQPPAPASAPGNEEGVAGQPEGTGEESTDGAAGQQGAQGGTGAGDGDGGQSQTSAPLEELGTEGVPLELDPGEEGPLTNQPSRGEGTPEGAPERSRGFTRGGAPDPNVVDTGTDPQRYPWELRKTLRDYFR